MRLIPIKVKVKGEGAFMPPPTDRCPVRQADHNACHRCDHRAVCWPKNQNKEIS